MIWDETEGRAIAHWQAHAGAINTLGWSTNGTRLASGGDDGQLIIWDAKAQFEVARFTHTAPVVATTWAPDNDRVASASGPAPGAIQIWSLSSGALAGSLKDPFEGILPAISLAWNPDGRRLAVGTAHWYVKVFDLETGKVVYEHRLHRGSVRCVSWSSTGEKLATASDDGTIRVQHFDLHRHYIVLPGHPGPVSSVAWVASEFSAERGLPSLQRGASVPKPGAEPNAVGRPSVAADQNVRAPLNGYEVAADGFLASGGQDGTVRLWPALDLGGVVTHSRVTRWLSTLAFDPQGRRLAMAWGDSPLEIWDTDTEVRIHRLTGYLAPLRSVAWSPNGQWIAGGDGEGKIHLWDAATGAARQIIPGFRPIDTILWQPGGEHLLVLEEHANEAALVDSKSGDRSQTLRVPHPLTAGTTSEAAPIVLSAAWTPDGRRVALGDETGRLVIFEAADGRIAAERQAAPTAIRAISWRADSRFAAVGGDGGTLRAIAPFDGRTVWTIAAHRGRISRVAWHPDGRRIGSAGEDGRVRLFDANTGEEVLEVAQHYNHITGLAWSPDGTKLATGSHDYDVWVFDAAFGTRPDLSRTSANAGRGATDFARRDYETALLLRKPWVTAGEQFDEAEWLPRALELVERQLRIDPEAAFLQAQRAQLLLKLGRLDEAAQAARGVMAQQASTTGAEIAGSIAREVLQEVSRARGD